MLVSFFRNNVLKIVGLGTSLVVQWLRIRLPMQGTRVRALVWEDPTCRGATKPVHHNYWAHALEPANHNYCSPHAWRKATAMRSPCIATKCSPHSPQLEKARVEQRRPKAAKKKKKKIWSKLLHCWLSTFKYSFNIFSYYIFMTSFNQILLNLKSKSLIKYVTRKGYWGEF